MLAGEHVLRVEWLPGSDRLRGTCFCGAESDGDDPAVMWEWLLAHPDHPRGGAPAGRTPDAPTPGEPAPRVDPPPAHYVDDPRKILRRRESVLA